MDTSQNKLSPSGKKRSLSPLSPQLPSKSSVLGTGKRKCSKPVQMKFPILAKTAREAGFLLYEILGMAELMRVAYEKGEIESTQNRLALLISEAANLSTALDNILELSKTIAEQAATMHKSFDIVALLQEISQTARQNIGLKPVKIMDVLPAGPLMIFSDPEMVRKIVTGLVSNAAKFTDRGRVALILNKDEYRIRLVITDTGRGMTAEQMNAAFAPSGFCRHPEGNGHAKSGLVMIRNLVKLLEGSITVSSKVGEGTIAEVSIPIEPSKNLTDSRQENRPETSARLR